MKGRSLFSSTRWNNILSSGVLCTVFLDDDSSKCSKAAQQEPPRHYHDHHRATAGTTIIDRLSAFVNNNNNNNGSPFPFEIVASGSLDVALDAIHIYVDAASTPTDVARRFTIFYSEIQALVRHTVVVPQGKSLRELPVVRPTLQLLLQSGHTLILCADAPRIAPQQVNNNSNKNTTATADDGDKKVAGAPSSSLSSSTSTSPEAFTAELIKMQFCASFLADCAAVLWRRQHGLTSALERAVLRSHPIDEALFVLGSLRFEAFATMDTDPQARLKAAAAAAAAAANNNSSGSNHSPPSRTNAAAAAAGGGVGGGVGEATAKEMLVRVEVSDAGILSIYLLPKDVASKKEFEALLMSSGLSGDEASGNNSNNDLMLLHRCELSRCIDVRAASAGDPSTIFIVLPPSSSSSSSSSSFHHHQQQSHHHSLVGSGGAGTKPSTTTTSSSSSAATAAATVVVQLPSLTLHLHTSSVAESLEPLSVSLSLPDLFASLSMARAWQLQPLRLHPLVPGAIQPFSHRELRMLHDDVYLNMQLQLSEITASKRVYQSGTHASGKPLFAIAVHDVPLLYRNLVNKNSEASHDLFLRKVLEVVYTAQYNGWGLELADGTAPATANSGNALLGETLLLTFADVVFAQHVLQRGGVNIRLLFHFGGIVRTFFHRGHKCVFDLPTFKRVLRTIHTVYCMTGLAAAGARAPSSFSSSSSPATSRGALFRNNPLLSAVDNNNSSDGNNYDNDDDDNDDENGNNNYGDDDPAASPPSFLDAAEQEEAQLIAAASAGSGYSSPQMIKMVEAQAEQIWHVACAVFRGSGGAKSGISSSSAAAAAGENTFDCESSDALGQFLALVKVAREIKVSALQHLGRVLENASASCGSFVAASLAVHPGSRHYETTTLLYLGLNLSAAAGHAPRSDPDLPAAAYNSPTTQSPRGRDDNGGGDNAAADWNNNNNNDDGDDDNNLFGAAASRTPRGKTRINNSSNKGPAAFSNAAAAAAAAFPTINLSELKPVPEKVIYDLSRNRVKSAQLTHETRSVVENITRAIALREKIGFFFTSYCDKLFSEIRRVFVISDADVWRAASSQAVKARMCFCSFGVAGCNFMGTSGRSASLFLRSGDGRFVFKQIQKFEMDTLRKTLPHYLDHILAYPNTLLPRYVALLKLASYSHQHEEYSYVLVMENSMYNNNSNNNSGRSVEQLFDLKGSMVGRSVGEDAREMGIACKDAEFVGGGGGGGGGGFSPSSSSNTRGRPVVLPAAFRDSLLRQLWADVSLLRSMNMTDYSLLLAVVRVEDDDAEVHAATHFGERGVLINGVQIAAAAVAPAPEVSALSATTEERAATVDAGNNNNNNNNRDDDDDGPSGRSIIILENCPVRRCVNYCVSSMHRQLSGLGSPLVNNNSNNKGAPASSSSTPTSYYRSFFGGLPAFEHGRFVEESFPSGIAGWPAPPKTQGRRFQREHPTFAAAAAVAAASFDNAAAAAAAAAQKAAASSDVPSAPSTAANAEASKQNVNQRPTNRGPQRLREIVIVSLLDCLTLYDFRKKAETVGKTLLLKEMAEVSCQPAELYAARFLNFCARDVFVPALETDV